MRADRWIGYTRAGRGAGPAGDPVRLARKQRMPNLLLIGPTNNGKSMIIEKFRRAHPPVSHPTGRHIPVLVRADAVRAVGDPVLRRRAGRDGRAAAPAAARWPSWSSWPWGCCARSACACW